MSRDEIACAYCGTKTETRPYGAKGERICFRCAMSPENKRTTERMFLGQLEAAEGTVGMAVLDTSDVNGPRPLQGEEH